MAVNASSVQSIKFTRHLISNSSPGVTVSGTTHAICWTLSSPSFPAQYLPLALTRSPKGLAMHKLLLTFQISLVWNWGRDILCMISVLTIQGFPLGYPPPIIPTLLEALNRRSLGPHCHQLTSLIPKPPRPAFVACSTKSGEKAWTDLSRDACHCWRHVQSAHIWVCSLPFTLLPWIPFILLCSVCPVSPIATGSVVASYNTWLQ